MKNTVLIFIAAIAALLSGCNSAPKTIDAASTKLEVKDAAGKSVTLNFPKELDAKKFDLSVDPATGVISLRSDSITTSSSGVIDSAGRAQAEAMAEMSKAVNSLASIAAPLLVPGAALGRKPQDTPAAEPAE